MGQQDIIELLREVKPKRLNKKQIAEMLNRGNSSTTKCLRKLREDEAVCYEYARVKVEGKWFTINEYEYWVE